MNIEAIKLVIVSILIIAGAVSVGVWQNHAGHVSERVVWQGEQNKELALANTKIVELTASAMAEKKQHETNLNTIASNYEKDRQYDKAKTDSLIAKYRSGTYRLRDPGYSSGTSSTPQSGVAPSSSGCNGSTEGGLSVEASGFLLGITGEADEVAKQLSACQAVIVDDRTH